MTHEATRRLLHPGELRIAVHEKTSPDSRVRVTILRKERHEHVLGLGPSKRQPLFALHLLPPQNHARTGVVPLDGGDLGVISLRKQFRALRVARDEVEGPVSRADHVGIDDLRATPRKCELDRWSLDVAGFVDQCWTQGYESGRCVAMTVSVWVSAHRYLGGVDD